MPADRIANLAASNALLGYVLRIQSRVHDEEVQVSSEKKSQDYAGIAQDSQRLVNIENTREIVQRYVSNNETMEFRLQSGSAAVEGARKAISDFKSALTTFRSQDGTKNEQQVRDIQDWAFRSLKAVQGYLNTEVNGRFLFSGSRVTTSPVNLGLSTLGTFQTTYDGARVTYPTTRDAHLADVTIDKDGNEAAAWLTFQRAAAATGPSRITSNTAQFANVKVGSKITVSGTASNDGTYTVSAVGGGNTTIDIVTEMLTDEATIAAATLTRADETVLSGAEMTNLSFDRANNRIRAAAGGSLTNIAAGSVITIAGTTNNNGTYTVVSNDGTDIIVEAKYLTDEGTGAPVAFHFDATSAGAEVSFVDNAPNSDTITAAAGRFTGLGKGMKVRLTGATDAGNNATFTVVSVATNGSSITVAENVTARANDALAVTFRVWEADGTITSTPYYQGDEINPTHRVDENRDFAYDINGINPAFEKAIRAMGIIAQGTYAKEGGLDQNATRVSEAIYLLESSLKSAVAGTPPYGTELTNNFEQVQTDIGFQQILVDQTNKNHKSFIGFLDQRIANAENADPLETISRLLDDSRALEASYQALARIRQLSLTNFL